MPSRGHSRPSIRRTRLSGFGRAFSLLGTLGTAIAITFLAPPGVVSAQLVGDVEVEALPSPVPLGQIVELEIRIRTQAPWALEIPDSIQGLRDFRQTGPVAVTRSTQNSDQESWQITYPLVPLRAGFRPLPALTLVLRESEGVVDGEIPSSQTIRVPLNGISVQSVLPPPGQPASPAPPRFPAKPKEAGSAFLFWAFLGTLLTGFGWVYLRTGARSKPPEQWGGNDDWHDGGQTPGLTDQLYKVLQLEAATEVQRAEAFDRSILLIRQILESRSPKTLSAFTTSELVTYIRNGSGLLNANTLETVLTAGENVRYRRTPPTERDLEDFKVGIRAWLDLEDPQVGRIRGEKRE